jgi:hypothetical protein
MGKTRSKQEGNEKCVQNVGKKISSEAATWQSRFRQQDNIKMLKKYGVKLWTVYS